MDNANLTDRLSLGSLLGTVESISGVLVAFPVLTSDGLRVGIGGKVGSTILVTSCSITSLGDGLIKSLVLRALKMPGIFGRHVLDFG